MYPSIEINLKKLKENSKTIVKMCEDNFITSRFFVSKVFSGDKTIVNSLQDCGFTSIADSRIDNLKNFQALDIPKVLLRLPMLSEVRRVVKYSDISLNSELLTIIELNNEALKQNKVHSVILMFDLGDLREGIFYKDDYLSVIEIILKLAGIKLIGIGTNLTCYGGVIPSKENLDELVNIKEDIEDHFSITLDIISGGNSSIIHLFNQNIIPKEINNLRIGEAVILGRETAYGKKIEGMNTDVFTLKAELIEVKEKPSYPIGEIGMDSFGMIPVIEDKGQMTRGILAVGKQDVKLDNIYSIDENIEIIGGSSDHLIVDITKANYKLGDIISFNINYPGLLQLMTSSYVKKVYID